MQNKPAYQDRIVVNPAILAGKPVVKGTRIPVDLVLERLEEDTDTTALFEDYPQLRNEDIKACLWLFVILQKWLFVNVLLVANEQITLESSKEKLKSRSVLQFATNSKVRESRFFASQFVYSCIRVPCLVLHQYLCYN